MASQNKHGFHFPRLGRRDHQVTPIEDGGRPTVSGQTGENKTTGNLAELKPASKQVGDKRLEREDKRARKAEMEKMEASERENRRQKRRQMRHEVREDLKNTPTETCATFCFILVVGSFLFGGGTALIVSGRENNIFDFTVVGATGLAIGLIFTVTGLYLLINPLCEKYKLRKEAAIASRQDSRTKDSTQAYIDETRRGILTSQIHDVRRQTRRPSNSDLYGDETSPPSITTPRDESFHSCTEPPFVAVPNHEKRNSVRKPVLLLDAKETSVVTVSPEIEEKKELKDNNSYQNTQYAQLLEGLGGEDSKLRADDITVSKDDNETTLDTSSKGDENRDGHADISKTKKSKTKKSKTKSTPKDSESGGVDRLFRHVSKNTVLIEHSTPDLDSPHRDETPGTINGNASASTQNTASGNSSFQNEDQQHRSVRRQQPSEITVPLDLDDSSSELDLPNSSSPSPRDQ